MMVHFNGQSIDQSHWIDLNRPEHHVLLLGVWPTKALSGVRLILSSCLAVFGLRDLIFRLGVKVLLELWSSRHGF